MTLLVGAAAILTSDKGISTCYSGLNFMVIGISILLGVSFAMFTGWASIMSKRKAPYLIRPSLSTSPFNKMVALQFQHFASYFLILLGTTGVIRNWSVTNFWGLLEIPAFGLGLLFGTIMLLRVFRGRFKNPQTEQVGGGNTLEPPTHPSSAPTKARATLMTFGRNTMKDQDDWESRIEAVLGSDTEKHSRNFIKWREHLLKELALPLRVTGIEDFPWEESYVFGGWSKKEYEELKKGNPSYTDEFELNEIKRISEDDDLIAVVKRLSDKKVFEIGLSWLEACEGGTEEHTTLNDYSVWRYNY